MFIQRYNYDKILPSMSSSPLINPESAETLCWGDAANPPFKPTAKSSMISKQNITIRRLISL